MNWDSLFRKKVKPSEYGLSQALEKIQEGAAFAAECGYDVTALHCRGCINTCPLTEPRCGVGARVVKALKEQK